jgi:hypothetical protein
MTAQATGAFDGFVTEFCVEGLAITAPGCEPIYVAWEDASETEYAWLVAKALADEAALEAWQERQHEAAVS